MLVVTFVRDSRERLSLVFAEGHAQAGDPGEDLVCAAASAILQAAELGLARYAGIDAATERGAGRMRIAIPAKVREREDVRAIVGTAELAIDALAQQFPANIGVTRARE